jgi:hypothetical protein
MAPKGKAVNTKNADRTYAKNQKSIENYGGPNNNPAGPSVRSYPGESPKSQVRPGLDKMSPGGTSTSKDGVYGIDRPARVRMKDGSISTKYGTTVSQPGRGADAINAGRTYGKNIDSMLKRFDAPYTGPSTSRNWSTGKKTSLTRKGGK